MAKAADRMQGSALAAVVCTRPRGIQQACLCCRHNCREVLRPGYPCLEYCLEAVHVTHWGICLLLHHRC